MPCQPYLYLECGPILRFTGIYKQPSSVVSRSTSEPDGEIWRGSVMIVTADMKSSYESSPTISVFKQSAGYQTQATSLIKLSRTGKAMQIKPMELLKMGKDISSIEDSEGLFIGTSADSTDGIPSIVKGDWIDEIKGTRLYAEQGLTFWKFNLQIELSTFEAKIGYQINNSPIIHFWIPARGQPMNIMFQSCNGFSLGVNTHLYSGPDPLWRDVLGAHLTRPFHVMIGGGDQLYNDECTVKTRYFREWLQMRNGRRKRSTQFSTEMRDELDGSFLEHYTTWFSRGLFSVANSQIPMINIWDDHDIIDGFGSYPHRTMASQVFMGLGATAFKFYMLFQHQSLPGEVDSQDPSWLLGAQPGPYIKELSRSLFMFLGRKTAFLGLDCRMERKRDQIMSDETWDSVFERCRREIQRGDTSHLIILLGVPIAYPRLTFIEDVLSSRLVEPLKTLARRGILPHKLLNKFDGGIEILDDLDDHWTAKRHKKERRQFIKRLQELAAEKSVRITILGGDVHLAAIGRFYSNRKLAIPPGQDFRYMVNVTSSAITNRPPTEAMAYIISRFGRLRHVDSKTVEDMIPIFANDVDGTLRRNACLLPRRNWCSICGHLPLATIPPSLSKSDTPTMFPEEHGQGDGESLPQLIDAYSSAHDNRLPTSPLKRAGNRHLQGRTNFGCAGLMAENHSSGAARLAEPDLTGGLVVHLNVERLRGHPSGMTTKYRLEIPILDYPLSRNVDENPTGKGC